MAPFSVYLSPDMSADASADALAIINISYLILSYLGVPIIEQKIGGHISTVTGQNSTKLGRLDG